MWYFYMEYIINIWDNDWLISLNELVLARDHEVMKPIFYAEIWMYDFDFC